MSTSCCVNRFNEAGQSEPPMSRSSYENTTRLPTSSPTVEISSTKEPASSFPSELAKNYSIGYSAVTLASTAAFDALATLFTGQEWRTKFAHVLNAATSAINIRKHPHVNHSNRTTYQTVRGKKAVWTFFAITTIWLLWTITVIFSKLTVCPANVLKTLFTVLESISRDMEFRHCFQRQFSFQMRRISLVRSEIRIWPPNVKSALPSKWCPTLIASNVLDSLWDF